MFDGQDVDFDDTAGCKQMGRYRRLMHMSACIVAAFGIAAPAFASGVVATPGQALNADVARAAIAQADRAVKRAEAQRVLWTTAEEALRGARRAFEDGDLATAVAQARVAKEHAELAIAQKRFPPFRN
jgi:murein lipoprotein